MKLDIEGFVERYFVDYKLAGDDFQVDCPFCEDRVGKVDNKKHLGIHRFQHIVHCFRCDYSSDWIGLVRKMTGYNYFQALGELYIKPSLLDYQEKMADALKSDDKDVVLKQATLPYGFQLLDRKVGAPYMELAIQYMDRRGFKLKQCRKYGLGVSIQTGARIVIPVEDDYWQARRLFKDMEPKYMNPPTQAKYYLFNWMALDKYDEVVVSEGAFSAMAVGDNAIAMISKAPTQERIERMLKSVTRSFILAVEPGAFPAMKKLADALYKGGKQVTVWDYSRGDPADPNGEFVERDYSLRSRIYMMMEKR